MHKFFLVLFASLALPAFVQAEPASKTMVVKIKGMVCESCEEKISETLMKIKGVEKVRVSHQTGEAEITLGKNSKVSVDQIKKAVKEAGFQAL